MYRNKTMAVLDTLYFDKQLQVHAKCTDIYIYIYIYIYICICICIYIYLCRYRYERELGKYLPLPSSHARLSPSPFLALFLLSSRALAARS